MLSLERDLDDIQSKLGMPDKTSGVEENQRVCKFWSLCTINANLKALKLHVKEISDKFQQQHVNKLSEPDSDSLDKKMVDWLEQAKKQLEETFNVTFINRLNCYKYLFCDFRKSLSK